VELGARLYYYSLGFRRHCKKMKDGAKFYYWLWERKTSSSSKKNEKKSFKKKNSENGIIHDQKIVMNDHSIKQEIDEDDENELPIFFIHGIGVGVLPYCRLVEGMRHLRHPPPAIFLLEIPNISMTMSEHFPTSTETVEAITEILAHPAGYSGIDPCWPEARFVGHSYGTIVATWCIKQKPSLVRGAVLIDPVCFLLFLPTTTRAFVYGVPCSTIEHVIDFFMAKDIYIGSTITRHFWWWENILWVEEIPSRLRGSMSVFLSGRDFIVPSRQVLKHLQAQGIGCGWWAESDHAGFLVSQNHIQQVLDSINNGCRIPENLDVPSKFDVSSA